MKNYILAVLIMTLVSGAAYGQSTHNVNEYSSDQTYEGAFNVTSNVQEECESIFSSEYYFIRLRKRVSEGSTTFLMNIEARDQAGESSFWHDTRLRGRLVEGKLVGDNMITDHQFSQHMVAIREGIGQNNLLYFELYVDKYVDNSLVCKVSGEFVGI